jgi:genome maintenance exonuclease 1
MFTFCPPKQLPNLQSITSDGNRLYTLPDGKVLPSITTVLGASTKQAIMEWRARVGEEEANRVSAKASTRGNVVHKLCEDYLNNELDIKKIVQIDAMEMFRSIKPHLNRINNIHYQEQALWSLQLGVAGRVDCIAEYDGVLSVIDFKTSKRVKKRDDILNYFWQATAYALMYEELVGVAIDDIVIMMAVEDNEPIVFKEKVSDHIDGLVKAIQVYQKSIDKRVK